MSLYIMPVELVTANAFVDAFHRHHQPVLRHRFSIGCVDASGLLRGVCIVGRPVARLAGRPTDVAEVTRLVTDGTPNACSLLYGAAARATRAMGFRRIQTYTLPAEGGASLRASGWTCEGDAGGGSWVRANRERRTDQPTETKTRWARTFDRPALTLRLPEALTDTRQAVLDI